MSDLEKNKYEIEWLNFDDTLKKYTSHKSYSKIVGYYVRKDELDDNDKQIIENTERKYN